ncbi:hypothetical protein K493DRAFT_283472 [Basidiobolus meristosporus CBS 931.73]|uniref:RRM domain-containing protein n=1 Tax=Basidiobolus meristosporus CBS 931.73 TaxID=1314790 RepID=A0A1Y1Y9V5_9FUNG|nr:hypothetical protein K493DRAFT_283472 [Basidiobolus meristosporus CBS 931.73]|eukprot:ORX94768.1 hypothetical protein K493DRAFT_283472 [Basidiobolus meristosporus CBS 931.73]
MSEESQPEVLHNEQSTKVFIGNLPFQTTQEELKAAFDSFGPISEATILTRGKRSLGYGFISFEKLDDAQKAVSEKDKSELDGRVLKVELARPIKREPEPSKDENHVNEGEENEASGEGKKGARGRGRAKRGRGAGRGRGRGANEDEVVLSSKAPRRFSNKRDATNEAGADVDAENGVSQVSEELGNLDLSEQSVDEDERGPRARRGRRFGGKPKAPLGAPSTQSLFIGNLPYNLETSALEGLFPDTKVTRSLIVTSKTGRSKGFGFVEFEKEEDQKKVLEEKKELTLEGRKLLIKVALGDPFDYTHSTEEKEEQ